MDPLYYAGLAVTGFTAGLLGSLLGLGGGVFVVSALVLGFRLPYLTAVGTSNVATIATSTAGASTYVRSRLTNIRLALLLLIPTTIAAVLSSLIASLLPTQLLSGLFALMLLYTSYTMFRNQTVPPPRSEETRQSDEAYDSMGLKAVHYDAASGKVEVYTPRRIREGMSISALAGVLAGLLGVGGGVVQMPVMNLLMGVPLKVATGTSSFMIGVTATSAAFVRYARGDVDPLIVVPVVLFVFMGARMGAWLVPRTPNALLRRIFGWVTIVIAILMMLQAVDVLKLK